MRIVFIVNPVFAGWEPTDTRLGGTEEAVVHWAEEFAKDVSNEVIVYRNSFKPNHTHNGVMYARREHFLMSTYTVAINVKSHDIKPASAPMIYVTNEMNADRLDLKEYSAVVWPSNWAKENIPVNNKDVFIVPHGYDPKRIYPGHKVPKQCFYASSPDRGLDTLLKAWPKVHKEHPDATLILTYGGKSDLPGVISLGNVDEDTMDDIYRTSDVWCHPANGGELYCITGIKAQAAGCVPVINPIMALPETVREFVDGGDDPNGYALALNKVLSSEGRRRILRPDLPTYADSAEKLMAVIKSVL